MHTCKYAFNKVLYAATVMLFHYYRLIALHDVRSKSLKKADIVIPREAEK